MRSKYLGDSYDIVKHTLLRWLAPDQPWTALPMFTHLFEPGQVSEYERLVGARVVNVGLVPDRRRRDGYFASATDEHLFVDPDTGLRCRETTAGDKFANRYVYAAELAQLVARRSSSALTVVFDQSLNRDANDGGAAELREKVAVLRRADVSALAYRSHACFVVAARGDEILEAARERLLRYLPSDRLVG